MQSKESGLRRPIRHLMEFPFLFKVVEFRISMLGFDKGLREKYTQLFFEKEKQIAQMSPSEVEQEIIKNIKDIYGNDEKLITGHLKKTNFFAECLPQNTR